MSWASMECRGVVERTLPVTDELGCGPRLENVAGSGEALYFCQLSTRYLPPGQGLG